MSRKGAPQVIQGEEKPQGEDNPGVLSRLTAPVLVKIVGMYSAAAVGLITFFVLASDASPAEKALIKMALGLIFIWIILGGTLMVVFRRPVRRFVRKIPLPWQVKFFLFCTLLALLEEGVTVLMTNLAPCFGAEVGEVFITASANYLHTVLFHSVIVFLPMFLAWTFLLRTFKFSPAQVFLLFGITGSLAEMSIHPANVLAGFWFFVYGLMVYLPAYSLPEERGARSPAWWAYLLAVGVPLVSPILLLPFAPLLRYLWKAMDPVFFVDSVWG